MENKGKFFIVSNAVHHVNIGKEPAGVPVHPALIIYKKQH